MEGSEGVFVIIGLVLRIIGAVVCSNKAKELNRSTTGWGFFGFFIPIIAMIWVHCIKPKISWDKDQ
jgi:hypothetical protein